MDVHPEPEFMAVLKPIAIRPSMQELKFLRAIDSEARNISSSVLSSKISEKGCWIISPLDYQEATGIREGLLGSSWELSIEPNKS